MAKELERCLGRLAVTNYVATVNLSVGNINLEKLARKNAALTYHRPTFAAMSMRMKSPRFTAFVYEMGVVVLMGANTKTTALFGCHKCVKELNKYGVKCEITGFHIDNVVSSTLAYELDLQMCKCAEWSSFMRLTDRFPGARLRCQFMKLPIDTKIVMEIFKSGKINITGARSLEEVRMVYRHVDEIILRKLRKSGSRYVETSRLRAPAAPATRDEELIDDNPGLLAAIEGNDQLAEYYRSLDAVPLEDDDEDEDGEDDAPPLADAVDLDEATANARLFENDDDADSNFDYISAF